MIGYMLNGRFVAGSRLVVDPAQPYFAHGEGLFETLRARGETPCFLNPHVDRMVEAARRLDLRCPIDRKTVRAQVEELLHRCGFAASRVKLHLLVRSDDGCDFLVTAEEVEELPLFGARVAIGRAAPQFNGVTAMPGLKTMNYMVNRLAEQEGRSRGLGEVVFTLGDDTVTEGTRSTVFFAEGGTLRTPPLALPILPGVTRSVILRLARAAAIPCREEEFPFAKLESADEVFLTGSVGGIRPVERVEGRALAAAPGPLTSRLAQDYRDLFYGAAELPDGETPHLSSP